MTDKTNIRSFYQHEKPLIDLIRKIAKDSENIYFPMVERKFHMGDIGMALVFACLEHGEINQGPTTDDFNNISCELKYFTAGTEIYIALTVDVEAEQIHILHVEG